MNYIEFTAGNETYKLRLTTRHVISLEKQLGCNPLMIFGAGDRVPSITQMVYILHYALQSYQHNINLDKTFDIWDAYLEDGHAVTDFIQVIVDIYKASGIMKNQEGNSGKND